MKLIKITNPSDKDVTDYPIGEAKVDVDGNIIMKPDGSDYEWTGRTYQWSIPSGATVEFPEYVADYLMKIYGFLKPAGELEIAEPAKPVEGFVRCKYCQKDFKNSRALGLHMASAHIDKML